MIMLVVKATILLILPSGLLTGILGSSVPYIVTASDFTDTAPIGWNYSLV